MLAEDVLANETACAGFVQAAPFAAKARAHPRLVASAPLTAAHSIQL